MFKQKHITVNPKKIFLLDGIGALVSAFLLGIVLVKLEHLIGMPKNILYTLSLLACSFAIYSFTCFFNVKRNWKPFLRTIAIVNLLYCCITLGLVIYLHEKITFWGWLYFILEKVIVGGLAIFELRMASIYIKNKV